MNYQPAHSILVARHGQMDNIHFTDVSYAIGHSTANFRTNQGEIIVPLATIALITVKDTA